MTRGAQIRTPTLTRCNPDPACELRVTQEFWQGFSRVRQRVERQIQPEGSSLFGRCGSCLWKIADRHYSHYSKLGKQNLVADALSRLPDTNIAVVTSIFATVQNRKIWSRFDLEDAILDKLKQEYFLLLQENPRTSSTPNASDDDNDESSKVKPEA